MGSHLLFFFLFLVFVPPGKPDLASDKAALLALRSAVGGRSHLWNLTQTAPCSWPGVVCEDNRVVVLRLPGVGLSGKIPSGTIGNLTQLRTLSLRLNALTGEIPADLASCIGLRNLYLQGNLFSGEIPGVLFSLHDLVRLNLAGNNFSGVISPAFNNLSRLGTLYLEGNQLSGSIPELKLSNLKQFNVSYNQLNGSIPSGFRAMPSNAFEGNSLCGGPLVACPGDGTSTNISIRKEGEKKKKKLSGGAIAGIVIGSVIGVLLILVILFILCRKKSSRKTRSIDIATVKQLEVEIPSEKPPIAEGGNGGLSNGSLSNVVPIAATAMAATAKGEIKNNGSKKLVFFGNGARFFDLEHLLRASAEVLGKGTFGTAYKAVLEVGAIVAVKRLKEVTIPEKEFRDKIETIGAMDHENLVPLRAYYFSNEEKLLVYDYMAMGSLSALLHGIGVFFAV
ncbi:hypothetical protein HHK36_006736 [Tetracentron sinense]|uniref:Protein kinase domain-containing protein n=1 Tax=Tetracentron sinense TaxID=13715 RepID=A0A834ZSA2_TETSI|nr:hypothetical protein HHK36_006736 [Tetracentron sinense]